MNTIEDINFLTYLEKNHPYLYDIEMGLRKIAQSTQFGEISFTVKMTHGLVDRGSVVVIEDKIYRQRKENVL